MMKFILCSFLGMSVCLMSGCFPINADATLSWGANQTVKKTLDVSQVQTDAQVAAGESVATNVVSGVVSAIPIVAPLLLQTVPVQDHTTLQSGYMLVPVPAVAPLPVAVPPPLPKKYHVPYPSRKKLKKVEEPLPCAPCPTTLRDKERIEAAPYYDSSGKAHYYPETKDTKPPSQ